MAGQEIFEAQISTTSFPPRLPGNKFALRYKVKSSDLNQSTTWSSIYYIDGPGITPATTNAISAATATKYEIEWSDTNICNYDLFVTYYIDFVYYPVTINSVGFDKTLYFLEANASSAKIPDELANFRVGDTIDVVGLNSVVDGVNMPITNINLTIPPYSVTFTGDSSNQTANTADNSGYFGTAESASADQNSRQHQYLTTYSSNGETAKSYIFKSPMNKINTADYGRAKVIIQAQGINKVVDPSLEIAKTAIGSL